MNSCQHEKVKEYLLDKYCPHELRQFDVEHCTECKLKCRGNSFCPCLDGSMKIRFKDKTVAVCRQCSESILECVDNDDKSQ